MAKKNIFARARVFFAIYLFISFSTNFIYANDGVKEIFSEAQASYREGIKLTGIQRRTLMLKAANQFQSLIEDHGINNGKLYYNIGNAFFEAGEKGKAILYYRKAERLMPGFVDLKYNLNIARHELELPQPKKEWWSEMVRGLFFWHFLFDYPTRRIVTIILFCFFWIILTLMIVKKHHLIKLALILDLAFLLSIGTSYFISAYELLWVEAGVITSTNAPARKGPGFSYEKVYEQELPEGAEFRLLKKQGQWWKVRISNGDDLWLNMEDAELI